MVLIAINVFATSFYLLFYHADQKVKNKLSEKYRNASIYDFTDGRNDENGV